MTTKEIIRAELDKLNEHDLAELLEVIKTLERAKVEPAPSGPGLLAKLKQVKIEGPRDFSTNLDLYLSGEKPIGDAEDLR
jgi:hypothetical protein